MSTNNSDTVHLDFAENCTTAVVTYYLNSSNQSVPDGRGTGVYVLWRDRFFVVTNTHVLERFCYYRHNNVESRIQIKGKEGERGIEEHNGYLLMPVKTLVINGVSSKYDHKDVGVIEIKPQFIQDIHKNFINQKDFLLTSLTPMQEIFYKGFPSNSVDFIGDRQQSLFGRWTEFRKVKSVHDSLIITDDNSLRYYNDSIFNENGSVMTGVSGSGVFTLDHKLAGLVWGGVDGSAKSALWIVPTSKIIEVLDLYIMNQYGV